MKIEKTFIELFAGVGGFRLGLERHGWRCVWANEWDKHANEIYRKRFESEELSGEKLCERRNGDSVKPTIGKQSNTCSSKLVEGDVREVEADSIPDHTLLCAGFPCQAFSIAGKRRGFQDTRGTLFHEICRIAQAKRTPILLLENVKGLLNHDGGRTFATILLSLDELGYDIEWAVLNSKYYGVPQNRERVFILGVRR